MTHFILLARGRGRFFIDLWNGEPVAWAILGGVVVIMGGWQLFKTLTADNRRSSASPHDEQVRFPSSDAEEE